MLLFYICRNYFQVKELNLVRAVFLFFSILIPVITFGQTDAPKYSNEFLSIGVDARAMGLSKSVVSSVNDVSSGYWNPAGLLGLKTDFEGSIMHSSYFAGIANFDYLGFAAKVDSSSYLGISLIRFAIDDIPDTRFLYDANGAINYDNIQFFSAADYAFLISYARKIPKLKNLQLGANFKIVHRSVGNFANAWGFGLDAGAIFNLKQWKFGAMARDITGTFNAWSFNSSELATVFLQTGNEIPSNRIEITLPRLIMGVSRDFRIKERFSVLVEINMEFTFDGKRNTLAKSDFTSFSPRAGVELGYIDKIFIRFGAGDIQQIKDFDGEMNTTFQPNFGIGINIKGLKIDYALTDIGNQAEALYSHVFSLKYGWTPKND